MPNISCNWTVMLWGRKIKRWQASHTKDTQLNVDLVHVAEWLMFSLTECFKSFREIAVHCSDMSVKVMLHETEHWLILYAIDFYIGDCVFAPINFLVIWLHQYNLIEMKFYILSNTPSFCCWSEYRFNHLEDVQLALVFL